MARNRVYISCYSCQYSKILANDREKMVLCTMSNRTCQLKAGMSHPEWCERKVRRCAT